MLYVDLKYISSISSHLRNFKKKKDSLYNFSCPMCGDSDKKKTKARGYFYQKNNAILYKCHNCGAGLAFSNFLRINFPSQYSEYVAERYRSNVLGSSPNTAINFSAKPNFSKSSCVKSECEFLNSIEELPNAHYAKVYVQNRKIPSQFWQRIFFTEHFDKVVDHYFPNKYSNLAKNDCRLVIPFYDESKTIFAIQGRSFSSDKKLRYVTVRKDDDNQQTIYGLDKFNFSEKGYVVEGPIDSLFLPNCLAASNSNLEFVEVALNKKLTLIYDNEPRNKSIVDLMHKAILNNRQICIWPKSLCGKDINDLILSGISSDKLLGIIQSRTFSGLQAQLELNLWRKI